MNVSNQVDSVSSKEELADFIDALRADLRTDEAEWENPTLEQYLEAMAAWIRVMDRAYENTSRNFPEKPSWKLFADILFAAKIYE